jgi:hypothetical protein
VAFFAGYFLGYIGFSFGGALVDPLYFTYHLAELFIIIPTGKDLVDTVATNMYQLRAIYVYAMPLRFKLDGRPIMSARLNVETARSERKRPKI